MMHYMIWPMIRTCMELRVNVRELAVDIDAIIESIELHNIEELQYSYPCTCRL